MLITKEELEESLSVLRNGEKLARTMGLFTARIHDLNVECGIHGLGDTRATSFPTLRLGRVVSYALWCLKYNRGQH